MLKAWLYFVISDCFIAKFYIVLPANCFIPTLETTHFSFAEIQNGKISRIFWTKRYLRILQCVRWWFICNITTYRQKLIPVTNWSSSHSEGTFQGNPMSSIWDSKFIKTVFGTQTITLRWKTNRLMVVCKGSPSPQILMFF